MNTCSTVISVLAAWALSAGTHVIASNIPVPDKPLQVIQTTDIRPNYGFATDVPPQGRVELALLVDETGKLQDMLLLGSNHRVYTEAAVKGLQEWKFEPAISNGQPVSVRTTFNLSFDTRGRVVTVMGGDVLAGLTGYSISSPFKRRLIEAGELDRPLRPVQTRAPRFPLSLVGHLTGETRRVVTVDFYVDEEGRPRMPVVINSDDALLSAAAIEAIQNWTFEPPLHKGTPAVVRAQQDFVFFESAVAEET